MNRIVSMFAGRMQRRRQWGRWMSVLAALGVGVTAAGMVRSRNGRLLRKLQQEATSSDQIHE